MQCQKYYTWKNETLNFVENYGVSHGRKKIKRFFFGKIRFCFQTHLFPLLIYFFFRRIWVTNRNFGSSSHISTFKITFWQKFWKVPMYTVASKSQYQHAVDICIPFEPFCAVVYLFRSFRLPTPCFRWKWRQIRAIISQFLDSWETKTGSTHENERARSKINFVFCSEYQLENCIVCTLNFVFCCECEF